MSEIKEKQYPLISVIVPIYNVENFLKDCVNSIINQTYENLEIILVDDGSTDNSGKISDNLASQDNRIKVIHKNNGGLGYARNSGLDIATGDYIGFVDADDKILPKMYEKLLDCALSNEADIVDCDAFLLGDEGLSKESTSSSEIIELLDDDILIYYYFSPATIKYKDKYSDFIKQPILNTIINPSVWSKLYKREIIANIRSNDLPGQDEVSFLPFVFENAKKYIHLKEQLYIYNQISVGGTKQIERLSIIHEGVIIVKQNIENSKIAKYNINPLFIVTMELIQLFGTNSTIYWRFNRSEDKVAYDKAISLFRENLKNCKKEDGYKEVCFRYKMARFIFANLPLLAKLISKTRHKLQIMRGQRV